MVKEKIISGIICEFNPFHNGHKLLLDQVKQNSGGFIVCVMSGNFVQRGECAVADKWTRTEAALKCGADLVLELPLPFATATAEKFALGGISVLNALNCADQLAFGSESCKVDELYAISRYLLSPAFTEDVKSELEKGLPFAVARSNAVEKALGRSCAALIDNGNDILAVEYLKAIIKTGSSLKPYAVKRHGVGHDEGVKGDFASASEIRRLIHKNGSIKTFMPAASYDTLMSPPADMGLMERTLLYKLRTMSLEEISLLPDISEGLENRIKNAAENARSLEELYSLVKSKRYSHARIRRILLSALLGVTAGDTQKIPYIRILGMNGDGREIVGAMNASLPVIGSYGDAKKFGVERYFELEAAAADIYALMTPQIRPACTEYKKQIIKI